MIPKHVKVGGLNYKVVEKDFVEISYNRNYSGSCDFGNTTIEILNSLSESRKEETFVHELTHAIFENAGYAEHDEDMVVRLSNVLYQVLKDNNLYFGDVEETIECLYDGNGKEGSN